MNIVTSNIFLFSNTLSFSTSKCTNLKSFPMSSPDRCLYFLNSTASSFCLLHEPINPLHLQFYCYREVSIPKLLIISFKKDSPFSHKIPEAEIIFLTEVPTLEAYPCLSFDTIFFLPGTSNRCLASDNTSVHTHLWKP